MQCVAASITARGFGDPLLIDAQDRSRDGIGRVEAAKLSGLDVISCIVANLARSASSALWQTLNRLQERGN